MYTFQHDELYTHLHTYVTQLVLLLTSACINNKPFTVSIPEFVTLAKTSLTVGDTSGEA